MYGIIVANQSPLRDGAGVRRRSLHTRCSSRDELAGLGVHDVTPERHVKDNTVKLSNAGRYVHAGETSLYSLASVILKRNSSQVPGRKRGFAAGEAI